MKKKISVLALMLCCLLVLAGCCSHEWFAATCEVPKTCAKCGETEGEALGHSWADATCTAPKTCSVCHAQEGSALGHNWVDATTEAPKTCIACNLTEGERIITDPRFTTAATKDLYGKWTLQAPTHNEWITDVEIPVSLVLQVDYEFFNDSTVHVDFTGLNVDEFTVSFGDAMTEMLYEQFAASNITRERADEIMQDAYGMSLTTYAHTIAQALDLSKILAEASFNGIYYVEDGRLFIASDWSSETSDCLITIDGDTLTMDRDFHDFYQGAVTFTRVAE